MAVGGATGGVYVDCAAVWLNPITVTLIGIVILSNVLAFANLEWIVSKWAYFLGSMSVLLVMIAYAAIGVPLANVMFPV